MFEFKRWWYVREIASATSNNEPTSVTLFILTPMTKYPGKFTQRSCELAWFKFWCNVAPIMLLKQSRKLARLITKTYLGHS